VTFGVRQAAALVMKRLINGDIARRRALMQKAITPNVVIHRVQEKS